MLGSFRRFVLLGGGFLTNAPLRCLSPALALVQPEARFGIEFFEQSESPLEVPDGLSDLGFEVLGEVDHGFLTLARLSEVLGAVLEVIVRSAPATRVAALAGHLDERAVDEAVGIVEKKMEAAAEIAFASGEGGGAGHEGLH